MQPGQQADESTQTWKKLLEAQSLNAVRKCGIASLDGYKTVDFMIPLLLDYEQ